MRKIELEELKKLQLQILDEVVAFCEQHNIKYFLMAGTLLGAIRHQGYIPWDDDIDIGMLREDYEKFIELYRKQEGDYYLYSHVVNRKCSFPFVKVCMKNTLIIEEFLEDTEKYGINIDIFPIDSVSSANSSKLIKKILFWIRLRNFKIVNLVAYLKKKDKMLIVRALLKWSLKIISYDYIFKQININLERERKSVPKFKGNLIWGYGIKELVDPSIFDELIEVSFEGKTYQAPRRYNEWLTHIYGDYMLLPPIEQRVSNHNVEGYVLYL